MKWLKPRYWERLMHAEFQFHLETQVNAYLEQGLTREQAETRARQDFGALELAKEECRDQQAFEPITNLLRDLRYALRGLRRTPAFTTAALLTLALGIGANTAIFSAFYGVTLKPLPYPNPDRLVILGLYNRSLRHGTDLSYPDFLDWQRQARSFEASTGRDPAPPDERGTSADLGAGRESVVRSSPKGIAAFLPTGFDLAAPGPPEHLDGYEISSNFFSTLGVNLALGRPFSPADDRTGGMPAVVISDRLWQQRFHGSRAAIGQSLTLNGTGYTITGVLKPGFHFEDQPADVYTPVGRGNPLFRNDRTVHDILCVARLRPSVPLAQAEAEMNTLQDHIDQLNPITEKGQGISITPLKQELVGDTAKILLLLLGAVGAVLLIACANVANLLLARSAARTREFAVRRAIGAGRPQIMRHLLIESLLLSATGGVLGLVVAKIGLRLALLAVPGSLPRLENIGLNAPVLVFALALSLVVGLLFGLAPALEHAGADLQTGLREGSRGSTSRHRRTLALLAVAQIALAVVLLSGAGLLLRTVQNLWAVSPGFQTERVLIFQIGLPPSLTQTASRTRAAYQQLTRRIAQVSGVASAGITALVPLGRGDNSGPYWLGSHQPASMAQIPRALYYPVDPAYVPTLRIPFLRGRLLSDTDTPHSQLVVLIDDLLARTRFPSGDALGHTLTIPHWGADRGVSARIVGIVGHVEQYGIDGAQGEKPQIYFSLYQLPGEALLAFRNEITFAVRTSLPPAAVLPAIRRAINETVGQQPVYNLREMRDLVVGSIAHQRLPMILLVAFAALSLLLATVGIYGVIAYSTAQRIPEIGIRLALGASRSSVLQMLLAQGLRLTLVGLALGLPAALLLARVLAGFSRLLFQVRPTDPLTFLIVSLCLLLAALLASYLPARRAARLDPMSALRHD